MTGEFPFQTRSWYPHLKPADVHLWEKFIRANEGFFDSVEYDVLVGDPPGWLDTEKDELAKKELPLYLKKIDVVGHKGQEVFICEIKPRAGAYALGQVLSYEVFWRQKHQAIPAPLLVIITNECQAGFHEIFKEKGVTCLHVGFCPQCRL